MTQNLKGKLKKEAAKKAMKKLKDAVESVSKGDFQKAKKDLKEAAHEYSKGNVVF